MHTIGASFSGGGFRATAFTFGCLELLSTLRLGDRTLLEHVAFSSSTSGGSLAMALHAVRSHQGVPFQQIMDEAVELMQGDKLLTEAMRILQDDDAWKGLPHKSRNLINAFALAYDALVFKGATLGQLADKSRNPPIDRYCFNATELNHGLSFRFDHDGDARTVTDVGNKRLHFAPGSAHLAHQLRMADIAASSSCFPVGFEPMVYPADFEQEHAIGLGAALENERDEPVQAHEIPFGIVDGGVVDNQGLYSLYVQTGRRKARGQAPFDLLISCDVSSFYMDEYQVPASAGAWRGGPRLGHLLFLLGAAGLCSVTGLALALWQNAWALAGVLALPAALVLVASIGLGRMLLGSGSGSWATMFNRFGWPLLRGMSLKTFRYFLLPRLRTLGLLLNNVFMNEIRRQQYRTLYEAQAPPIPIVACMVYELATKNRDTLARRMRQKREAVERAGRTSLWDTAVAGLEPSPSMQAVADSAAEMPTTLWFDPDNRAKLQHLIACGRFTMCYNLLVHLADTVALSGQLNAEQQALHAQLTSLWEELQLEPTAVPTLP
jgi:hypothetical protein